MYESRQMRSAGSLKCFKFSTLFFHKQFVHVVSTAFMGIIQMETEDVYYKNLAESWDKAKKKKNQWHHVLEGGRFTG